MLDDVYSQATSKDGIVCRVLKNSFVSLLTELSLCKIENILFVYRQLKISFFLFRLFKILNVIKES